MNPLGTGDPLRLGPYRLLGVLGEGGMGKVYFGRDGAGRPAALKVLRPELAHDQHLAQRFVREAQMARAVTGKGVARVLGARTEGGRPWIATEFLVGPTLEEAIQAHGPMDEPTVRALASALARTLQDIHAAGLIHRDLKPANIVLTASGPRVIDFGIARPEHGLTLTTTGQIPVTPGYGAPEQVLGQRVGPAADVFSLGAVLVHAATGRRAFDASHVAAVQYEVVHGAPDLSLVPPALQPLIGPCLAKDAAMRPTPAHIGAAFGPLKGSGKIWRQGPLAVDIEQRGTGIDRVTAVGGSFGAVPRRRLLTALAAGGTVLAAAGGTGAWWLLREEGPGGGGAGKAPGPFDIPPAVKTPAAPLLNIDDGSVVIEPGEDLPPLWGPLNVLAEDSPPPKPVRDVIVFGAPGGGIAAHGVVDGRKRWAAPDVDVSGRYISVSDRLIAAVGDKGDLLTFVASTGERKWTAPVEARSVLAADDTAVYVVTRDGRLRAVRRSDATVLWTAPGPVDLRTEVPPRGTAVQGRLVICTAKGQMLGVDTRDGSKVWQVASGATHTATPEVDKGVCYFGGTNLHARRVSDGGEVWTTKPHKDYEGNPESWSAPLVAGDLIYVMRGRSAQQVRVKDGTTTWDRSHLGTADTPVLLQGSCAWMVDSGPQVQALELRYGMPVSSYTPRGEVTGFTADGNRVFVATEGWLTALPVF
ncbi:serine/threonine-protein kinase [Streptomyces sp. SP18CS02]|uniref:serine/threonine-protein kinase n=1 Tax=Streptomyces sp. SP18CS02 TaxID=3002531 RepID=UPI002E79E4BF|nr:serine/threonine-protein kinase [Streptomyces sp. SP18CS02]MEE1752266.1 serine/threonine-protein kinase [Streptomyces sp. SP18CS02]